MRRKSTEKFMRDAMSFKAPEEVWDKIKEAMFIFRGPNRLTP